MNRKVQGIMKVLVIGLGSMGKRRIRLVRQYDGEIEVHGTDRSEERRRQAQEEYGITVWEDLEQIQEGQFDCAFICTSPLSHAELINRCLHKEMHVFTEINLVADGYDDNMKLAGQKGKVLFLSSSFLYREEVCYIDKRVREQSAPVSYLYHIGQYLPDWHPWEDYRDYFIGDKRTNGCREVFAIELPWLVNTFGEIKNMHTIKGKNSTLAIDYADQYIVSIEHENGVRGAFAVDVVSRKAVRNLEVFSEELYLSWDGTPEGLFEYDYIGKQNRQINLYGEVERREGYGNFIIENEYINETAAFFAQVKDGVVPIYDFEKDKRILALVDEIEKE